MRIRKSLLLVLTAFIVVSLLAGCAQTKPGTATTAPRPVKIKLGVLPVIDSMPLYVARDRGYFKDAGVDVELVPIQSAQERDQAFVAKAIDGGISDSVSISLLINGGADAKVASLSMGATPDEGRFAIVVSPKANITDPSQLKGVPVGISSNSVIEYVTEKLLLANGLQPEDIKFSEVAKIPVRMEMLANGQLKAATLPEPLVTLARMQGAKVLLDDTKSPANLSQSVLMMRGALIKDHPDDVKKLLQAYSRAVADIDKDPNSFRSYMVDQKILPAPLKDTYEVDHFPLPQLPKEADFVPVLDWLKAKKLIKDSLTFDQVVAPGLTGQ